MKLTRDYLTSDELIFVVASLLEKNNAVEREIAKVGIVAQCLIDDLGEYTDCNSIYDKVVSEGIDFDSVVNYKTIDELINKEIGADKVLKDFLDDLNDKLDKSIKKLPKDLKNFKIDEFIEQLKEVVK
ncbi:MAG: hypothetical protein KBT03_04165 [Bacteroidales bacterium]|nr:hypothetical protein [Candidatus Scybalousia scybalohippi]